METLRLYTILALILTTALALSKPQKELVIANIRQLSASDAIAKDLTAIAFIESSFNPEALGKAKEKGLFQFHPKYFALKDKSIKGQVKLAIVHYNWLKKTCPKVKIALSWNLGCFGAAKIKKPLEFGYYVKFRKERQALLLSNSWGPVADISSSSN